MNYIYDYEGHIPVQVVYGYTLISKVCAFSSIPRQHLVEEFVSIEQML